MESNTNQTNIIGMLNSPGSLEIARRIYNIKCISACLNAHAGDTVPKLLIKNERNN